MTQTSTDSPRTLRDLLKADRTLTLPDYRVGLTWFAVALGLFLRILEYTDNRPLYGDELLLLENLTKLPVWDLHTVLTKDQVAPPGFLVLERMMVRLPFPTNPSARFIPFVAAILTMWYFPKVARQYLDPRAVPLATMLFALGDYSIYYTSEIKQYSIEVALALMALGLAARVGERGSEGYRKNLAILAIFGIVGVWFSFPLIFSLAGIGLVGLGAQLIRKDWKRAGAWAAIGLGWLVSFGGCFLVSDRIVTKAPFLRTWWDFAFLRIPPRTMAEATGVFWQLVNVIIAPTGVITPMTYVLTGLFCGALCVVGFVALLRKSPSRAIIIAAPFATAVAAAALKQYPFHGRLIQFLIPSVLFVLTECIALLSRKGTFGWRLSLVISAFLLIQPIYDAGFYRLIRHRYRSWDTHGDLHHDLLDELDGYVEWPRYRGQ